MTDTPETKHATLRWLDGMRFEGGEPGGPQVVVDADNATAPGPMLQLLLAAASCAGADVVSILKKMQVGLESLEVRMDGTRRAEHPKRYTAIHYTWTIKGTGLDEAKARRAIDLSMEKYCSVLHSLAPDIATSYDLRLG
ncbi:MAG TPA: OsmC family protein [Gemmatimonadales bacterium]|nr:OsmC family protein [Gemmatimonadales bacterium]HRZ08342.1 OsmC family protein [Gemmatimonadales bacterium]